MSSPAQDAQQDLRSPLLQRARDLGLQLPLDLERLALGRGCDYYEREIAPRIPPLEETALSNEELAIALVVSALRPSAREIRLAAALLGAPDVRADRVAALAVQENCADIVRHIAQSGRRFEAENPFWMELLDLLPGAQKQMEESLLPHPTRFVEMTGIERGRVGRFTRWIRPWRSLRII